MNTARTQARIAALALSTVVTLAMLLSIDTLAVADAAAPQMAAVPAASAAASGG